MGMAVGPAPQWRRHYHFKPRRWLFSDGDRLVKIKSWWPSYVDGELGWPVMLIDVRGSGRMTATPIWNRYRFVAPFITWERLPGPPSTATWPV